MKRTLARGGAVALLALAMAITPLSVVFSAGRFEAWLPAWDMAGRASAHVTLDDQTGLVRAISDARPATGPADLGSVVNPDGNRYVLQVIWGDSSCVREAHLRLWRSAEGYALEQRTSAYSCGFLNLSFYSVAIYLWSPVDAALVTLRSD